MSSELAKNVHERHLERCNDPSTGCKITDCLMPVGVYTDGVNPVKGALAVSLEAITLQVGWFSAELQRQEFSKVHMGFLDDRLARGSLSEKAIIDMLTQHGQGMELQNEKFRSSRAKQWLKDFERTIHQVCLSPNPFIRNVLMLPLSPPLFA